MYIHILLHIAYSNQSHWGYFQSIESDCIKGFMKTCINNYARVNFLSNIKYALYCNCFQLLFSLQMLIFSDRFHKAWFSSLTTLRMPTTLNYKLIVFLKSKCFQCWFTFDLTNLVNFFVVKEFHNASLRYSTLWAISDIEIDSIHTDCRYFPLPLPTTSIHIYPCIYDLYNLLNYFFLVCVTFDVLKKHRLVI